MICELQSPELNIPRHLQPGLLLKPKT